jgi:suppressor of tumorigenicity protein 13
LNPAKAVFFASRAEAFFKQKKPNAAIKDATRALELNPDQAKAYKVRGKAKRFLGQYQEGIQDLHTGQKLDWDEDTQAVIEGIKARVEVLTQRKREAERKRQEKELAERKRRVEAQRKAQEEARKRQAEEAEADDDDDMPGMEDMGGMGGMGGGMGGLPPELLAALQDPSMQKLLQDPEVVGLFTDATLRSKVMEAASDPTKHANDPQVQALLKKVAPLLQKIGSMKGGAGARAPGGFPGGFPGGGFGGAPGGGFPGGAPGGFGGEDLDVD